MTAVKHIFVTGGNQGIGFSLCSQLCLQKNCHVFLSARNESRGLDAVSKIQALIKETPTCSGTIEFVQCDVSNLDSIQAAASTVKSKLGQEKLYALVNNAGVGLSTSGDIMGVNLYGVKNVVDSFLSLIDPTSGRIVNLGSGAGPMYVEQVADISDKKMLCSPETVTWDWIEKHAKEKVNSQNSYAMSKALLAMYTGVLAREHPNIKSSVVSPGFVETQLTAGFGSDKITPEQGTKSTTVALFDELEGNGRFYGSDGLRSPYHFKRSPGSPEWDGKLDF